MQEKAGYKSNIILAISVLLFLLVATILINLIKDYGLKTVKTVVPQTEIVTEIKLELASTHLWLEEFLNGDTTVTDMKIILHLDNIRKYCWLLTDGGNEDNYKIIPLPETNLDCRTALFNLCEDVKIFDNHVRNRIQNYSISFSGSLMDQQFDSLYIECINSAITVEKSLHKEIEKEIAYFDQLQILLFIVMTLFSILYATFLIWSNNKRLKILSESRRLNNQLNASNQYLQASEQQLKAINQQFMASEQQLQAANQQLQANELQLKATNQQLEASEQQLKATNQQLRASEQLLQNNEQKYRSLFENMVEGAALHEIICDHSGKAIDYEIIEINKAYSSIMDKDMHLLIGKRGSELSNDGTVSYLPIYSAVADTGIPFLFESYFPFLNKHLSVSVYSPSKGKFVTTISDITDKKKSEEEIQLLADQNNTILRTINDVIIEIDADMKFCWGNRASDEFFDNNYIGKKIIDYVIDDDDIKLEEDIKELFDKKRETLHFEISMKNRFGQTIHQLWWMKSIYNQNGGVLKVLGTARDITEQRNIEERLRHTEKMEAIGQLAGGIAHDFNNQLSGMMGYADILREEVGDSPDLARYADNILLAIRRSADLTSQLLAFARKGKYRTISVDLHKIIFETVGILQRSINKNISIKQELNANRPFTLGDPTQIESALLNIGINARDALPEGGEIKFISNVVQLDTDYCIEFSNDLIPGKYIKVDIIDNGIGISEEVQEHIFEPFYTTKELGKGTGMGLAAVYGTMNNHKGTIAVESTVGIGTIFSAYFPLNVENDETESFNDISAIEKAKTNSHILFVDDEEMLCEMATLMFKGLGYEVTAYTNSVEALNFYKENYNKIDLVILDMVMPIMDGKDLFNAMKKINPQILSLLASGYSIDGRAQSIIDEGVKGFIQKPFRKAKISKIVADTIKPGN